LNRAKRKKKKKGREERKKKNMGGGKGGGGGGGKEGTPALVITGRGQCVELFRLVGRFTAEPWH